MIPPAGSVIFQGGAEAVSHEINAALSRLLGNFEMFGKLVGVWKTSDTGLFVEPVISFKGEMISHNAPIKLLCNFIKRSFATMKGSDENPI